MVNLMGGLIPARPGVYRSWCFATNWAWKNIPGEVTAAVAEVVRQSLLAGAHRIETVCYATRHNALKWYESLGLRYESTMKGYCVDGTDAVMYVATKELH
jgi:ribosomal protein S18 acetylase RimI-like enzyme